MKEPVAATDLKKFDAVQSTAFKSKGGVKRIDGSEHMVCTVSFVCGIDECISSFGLVRRTV